MVPQRSGAWGRGPVVSLEAVPPCWSELLMARMAWAQLRSWTLAWPSSRGLSGSATSARLHRHSRPVPTRVPLHPPGMKPHAGESASHGPGFHAGPAAVPPPGARAITAWFAMTTPKSVTTFTRPCRQFPGILRAMRLLGWTVLTAAMTASCLALAGCAGDVTNAAAPPASTRVPAGTSTRNPAPTGTALTVGFDHLGPVKLGMTPSQAARRLGVQVASHGVSGTVRCFQPQLARPHDAVTFLVEAVTWDGPISRFDVGFATPPGLHVVNSPRTDSGVGVGDSEAQVKAAYPGRVKMSAHTYVPGGHYLEVLAGRGDPPGTAIVFETDTAGRVTSIRWGSRQEAEYVEGCA